MTMTNKYNYERAYAELTELRGMIARMEYWQEHDPKRKAIFEVITKLLQMVENDIRFHELHDLAWLKEK